MAGKERAHKVGIIGGGASGMMAAIFAAKQGASVTLLEGNDRVGKKLLSTGNGKCNLTNENMSVDCFYTSLPSFVLEVLNQFDETDLMNFCKENGLLLRSREGYVYPYSEQAAAVLDTLRFLCEQMGVEILCQCKVSDIIEEHYGFFLIAAGKRLRFDKVIMATGGRAMPVSGSDGSGYSLAKNLGHSIMPIVPALVSVICEDKDLKTVAGVRAKGTVTIKELQQSEFGEIQFTEYGLSGIPVFQLSRQIGYLLRKKRNVVVTLDMFPEYQASELVELLKRKCLFYEEEAAEKVFTGILPKKLMHYILKKEGLSEGSKVSSIDQRLLWRIVERMKEVEFLVTGTNSYDKAQVCAGGIPLEEVNTTMESKLIPGLFFCGELLDVDGKCGGYNLQWAFSTGAISGKNAGQ